MRALLLILLAVGLAVLAIATWGSIGSVTMVVCLLLMAGSLFWQRFLTNNEHNDFDMEQ